MKYEDLTPQQQERARACKSADELLALAKDEGVELSEEQLQAVAGGSWDDCGKYSADDDGIAECPTAWNA